MEYLNTSLFTGAQLWIVEEKLNGSSYAKIKQEYKGNLKFAGSLSSEVLKTCLKRSSLSLQWSECTTCGIIPIIPEVDVFTLKEYVLETAIDGSYKDVDDAIEKADFLRKIIFQMLVIFQLKSIVPKLQTKLEMSLIGMMLEETGHTSIQMNLKPT